MHLKYYHWHTSPPSQLSFPLSKKVVWKRLLFVIRPSLSTLVLSCLYKVFVLVCDLFVCDCMSIFLIICANVPVSTKGWFHPQKYDLPSTGSDFHHK